MILETAARTDTGRQRDHNEDSVAVARFSGGSLLAVADGMGGHRAGDVASETAIEALLDHLDGAEGDPEAVLREGVAVANEAVHARADGEREGMGTTLVAALVAGGEATVVNVGDSRAYLVGDDLERVTVDQTLVRELVEAGTVDESEAADHPHRHVLSQALGTSESVDPDAFERPLDGRALLLCSDGLTEEVEERSIARIVRSADEPARACERLVERANENGGSDNVSAVLGWPAE